MLNIFSTKKEKEKATQLVATLIKLLPPRVIDGKRKVLSIKKISDTLEKIYTDAASFTQEHKLGFYKRSILANTFRWEMDEKGYPKDFIQLATEGLVVEISRSKKTNSETNNN